MAKTLISIVGPTGVGKTALSLGMAERYGTEIISSDARQLYRGLDIGTAKPTYEERTRVPHHFIDLLEPSEPYSAGRFEREADALIEAKFREHDHLIVVGGSTLYVNALWFGIDEMPEIDPVVRSALRAEHAQRGLGPLLEELARVDPPTFDRIDRQNPARVLRALEVFRSSGRPISAWRTGRRKQVSYRHRKIGLRRPRPELYARIDARVDAMVAAGLFEEVEKLRAAGYTADDPGLRTIGYREVMAYFDGAYDRARAISLVQRNSRRYAKRQLTYYRRFDDISWYAAEEVGDFAL